ncbi:hypothetical protein CR51_26220 [Caballeronia megalochromosomata]|nr:hypothetical protein CR51_26220 [Caballeronia megalochromosomata]
MIVSRSKSRADDHGNIGWISGLETFKCRGTTVLTIQVEIQEYQVRGGCLVYFFKRAGKRKYGRDVDWGGAELRRVCLDILGKRNAKNFVVIDP